MTFWEHMGFGASMIYMVLGMVVVFVALIAINVMIKVLSKMVAIFEANQTPAAPAAAPVVMAAVPAAAPVMAYAPAAAQGEIDLVNVDDKSAAMIMAIVADEMKTPLSQLSFKSIRQR